MDRRAFTGLAAAALAASAVDAAATKRTVALLFDSLTTPFWLAAIDSMREEAARRGWSLLEAVSNMDDNKQFQQVRSMLQRGVDGIVMVHTDDKAVIPAIRTANRAGVPLVHFNRPPASNDGYSVAVVADNRKIMRETVTALLKEARRLGGQYKAVLLVGDLGDANAVQRRDGFQDAVDRNSDIVEVVARVATEWNADKAYAGLTNALQAHPDINLLVTSSDFLTPQIEQALRAAGKWRRAGEPGHVLIASFDGDANAYTMLKDGYFDVDGVQDLYLEVQLAFDALENMWAGQRPEKVLVDPGLVVERATVEAQRDKMWGFRVWTMSTFAASAAASGVATTASAVQGAYGWSVALILAGAVAFAQAFLSIESARDIALSALPLAILAAGQMLVLIIGKIDLSMTAVMALSSIVGSSAMTRCAEFGGFWATCTGIVVGLVVGIAIGLFNGFCTALLRMPAFIVTLAVMMFGSGAAIWYGSVVSDTSSIGDLPQMFVAIGYGTVGGVPAALILCVLVLLTIHVILSRTLLGRWLEAIGHNVRTATIAAIPVERVTLVAFALSGLCAALASIIMTARLESGQPTLGENMLLDIIGATVIGGVSLYGGRGTIWMVLGGVLLLSLLDKALQLLGLSLFLVLAIKGSVILIAAVVDAARWRRKRLS